MKKLTISEAKNIAESIFSKMPLEDRDFYLSHSQAVVTTAQILAEESLDKDALIISGWLHDIGYSISKEEHAKNSIEILEKEYLLDEKTKDCILNHGSKASPQTEEGKLFQKADKISFLNPELVKIIKKYTLNKNPEDKTKDLKFIKNTIEQAILFLKS